jgi:CP family cyanate transporter-like MFS transporter
MRLKLAAILAVALNMRGTITCVGPLLKTIQEQIGLSGTAAGLLTSRPLFAFGFLSPYAAPLARRLGMERAIFMSSLLLLAGLGLACAVHDGAGQLRRAWLGYCHSPG